MSYLQQAAQQLLFALKTDGNVAEYLQTLAWVRKEDLFAALGTNEEKMAFWINVYNAMNLHLLKQLQHPMSQTQRVTFYGKKQIDVSGKRLSLNDIEHGFLRKSKVWWSLGYLNKWTANDFESKVRVSKLDPRIHFALNCGAASCPPIRFYEADKIDQQLDWATQAFLETEAQYEQTANIVRLSEIFRFYIGDFGGKKGVIAFLKKHEALPQEAQPAIKYTPYNWDVKFDAFA